MACHAAYQRINRLKHSELNPIQKKKANCRSYANVYERRGKLVPQPCEYCGDTKVQKHHEDYDKPLDVKWLCKPCHLNLHELKKLEENQGDWEDKENN